MEMREVATERSTLSKGGFPKPVKVYRLRFLTVGCLPEGFVENSHTQIDKLLVCLLSQVRLFLLLADSYSSLLLLRLFPVVRFSSHTLCFVCCTISLVSR